MQEQQLPRTNVKIANCLFLVILPAMTGCAAPSLPDYVSSRETLYSLQQLPPAKASVGSFTGGPDILSEAAAGPLFGACLFRVKKEPSGNPSDYHNYLRESFVDELEAAGRFTDPADGPEITGHIEKIALGRHLPFGGKWTIDLLLGSSTGSEMRVHSEHNFDVGAFAGPTVCRRAVEAFAPAIKNLFENATRSPEFLHLISKSQ